MASAPLDIGTKQSISSTSMVAAYTYTVPGNKILLLREVALTGDSVFYSNGKVLIEVGNDILTSQGSQTNETDLTNQLSIPFPEPKKDAIFLKALLPGEQIKVFGRVTSGTGVLQVAVFGLFLSTQEWDDLQRETNIKRV